MGEKRKVILSIKDVKIKGLDGSLIKELDANGKEVDVVFRNYNDLANAVYRNVTDIDFVAPLQQLSKSGEAEFDLGQLAVIETIVKQYYTLPFQLAICERIGNARNSNKDE